MKTSKFAIALIALIASNAHAQLTNLPGANVMDEAEICKAVATHRFMTHSEEILEISNSDMNAQDKAIITDALVKEKSEAQADYDSWNVKWTKARMMDIPYGSNIAPLLIKAANSKEARLDLINAFHQDCQNSK